MSPPKKPGWHIGMLGTGDAGWKCFWLCPQHTCTHTLTQTRTHASYWVVAAAAAAEQDSRPKKGKTAPHSGDAAATRERGETKTRKKGGMDRNRYVLGGNPRTFTLIRGRGCGEEKTLRHAMPHAAPMRSSKESYGKFHQKKATL